MRNLPTISNVPKKKKKKFKRNKNKLLSNIRIRQTQNTKIAFNKSNVIPF